MNYTPAPCLRQGRVEDIQVLQFFHKRLGCGTVVPSKTRSSALFRITGPIDLINNLFPLFDTYFLNTTKFLNYLVFKEILILYKNKKHLTFEGMAHIKNLLGNYNRSRTDFKMPAYHKINITPY